MIPPLRQAGEHGAIRTLTSKPHAVQPLEAIEGVLDWDTGVVTAHDDAHRGLAVLVGGTPVCSDEGVHVVAMEGAPIVLTVVEKLVGILEELPLVRTHRPPALEDRQIHVLRPPRYRQSGTDVDDQASVGLLAEGDVITVIGRQHGDREALQVFD